ncbi:hypothetical protein EYF80_010842 [Liparis tanakae]|uniref:Uncharacterized protein n=1 Tax=Liparis tanakae TaxID=230148 RepID=A0A4Z2ILY6_9TELE|nr:hypothetical protein EYF80_010842 [Liparis tanakae]
MDSQKKRSSTQLRLLLQHHGQSHGFMETESLQTSRAVAGRGRAVVGPWSGRGRAVVGPWSGATSFNQYKAQSHKGSMSSSE